MTISAPTWVRRATTSLSWPRRSQPTPVAASAADRELERLRYENRKQLQNEANHIALVQFSLRR